jgi:NAD(P)H-hydrate epimerase
LFNDIHSLLPGLQRPLVCCGPGNNGGDGLVIARHLKHFGMRPQVLYPKLSQLADTHNQKPSNALFLDLIRQCRTIDIEVVETVGTSSNHDLLIDALFGFGFKGEPRAPYFQVIEWMIQSQLPIVSIDVPSGWDVDKPYREQDWTRRVMMKPDMLVSLTAPKYCADGFEGAHYLGGRFIPRYVT